MELEDPVFHLDVVQLDLSDFAGTHAGQERQDVAPVEMILDKVLPRLPVARRALTSVEKRLREDALHLVGPEGVPL
jgi:hypothetical protein